MKVIFSFHGGLMDGEEVVEEMDVEHPGKRTSKFVFLTGGGQLGKRFREPRCPEEAGSSLSPKEARRAKWEAWEEATEAVTRNVGEPSMDWLKEFDEEALRSLDFELMPELEERVEKYYSEYWRKYFAQFFPTYNAALQKRGLKPPSIPDFQAGIDMMSQFAKLKDHIYEVTERTQYTEQLSIRLDFVGEDTGGPLWWNAK